MTQASVIFLIVLIVLAGVVGVVAASFERKRVRENASPDRIAPWYRRRARATHRVKDAQGRYRER